ncbi:hypothetical protein DXN05_09280 [Deminuibacter soli]|uniref:Uncharacterized protein n=1 Tax=Deminuibacter soli TaxID=2291815 RepID=A0A3E1NLY9_9BACT|nr:hypothetical protein DXN05_09280 [Deminuibacter soli]
MNNYYTTYQIEGLGKLISFKPNFEPQQHKVASQAAEKAQQAKAMTTSQATVMEFTRIFCDHLLADTDYAIIQREEPRYPSQLHYIANMQLDAVMKTLTYIIWTDRIVEGYFISRIKDMTVTSLLNRLEVLLMHSYNQKV